jgi:ceramide glucosyltransferase
MHSLPIALAACAARPAWWPLGLAAVGLRGVAAWAVARYALSDRLVKARWFLLPLQDLLSFGCWIGGFFGNTIHWRGRKYTLLPDGRFELTQPLQ